MVPDCKECLQNAVSKIEKIFKLEDKHQLNLSESENWLQRFTVTLEDVLSKALSYSDKNGGPNEISFGNFNFGSQISFGHSDFGSQVTSTRNRQHEIGLKSVDTQ